MPSGGTLNNYSPTLGFFYDLPAEGRAAPYLGAGGGATRNDVGNAERLREGRQIVEISDRATLEDRIARARAAMAIGAEVIYQGALLASQ